MATRLIGCAAPYDIPTLRPVESSRFPSERLHERFSQSAFDGALACNTEVFALANHDWNLKIARTSDGSLSLYTTGDGLRFELALDESALAQRVLTLVRGGMISGVSVGFVYSDWKCEETNWRNIIRNVRNAHLLEISLLAFPRHPAFAGTSVRAIESKSEDREMERATLSTFRSPSDRVKLRSLEEIWADGQKRLKADEVTTSGIDLLRRRLELEDA